MDLIGILSFIFGGFGVALVSWAYSEYRKRRARVLHDKKRQEEARIKELCAHLQVLRNETLVLFPTIVRCLQRGESNGNAEIMNVTIQKVLNALNALQSRDLLEWRPSYPDLLLNTVNRVYFEIKNPGKLLLLLKKCGEDEKEPKET